METDTNSCRSEIVPVSCKYSLTKRNVLNLCVNVFSTKVVIGDTIFTSTGLQFYAVIRTTQRSSRFGSVEAVPLFLIILRPWVLSRARELNPRPPALESSALPTEPILLLNKSFTHVEPRLAYKVWCACSHCTKQCHRNPIRYVTTRVLQQLQLRSVTEIAPKSSFFYMCE